MPSLLDQLGGSQESEISAISTTVPPEMSEREVEITENLIQDTVAHSEQSFNTSEVIALCKTSLDFLAGFVAPLTFTFLFPPVFISVWIWLLSFVHKARDFSQLALGLPRGFGKTTLIKVFILYCILFTNKKFILIISSTATLAENILSDVIDMLNEPNVIAVFGDWKIGVEKDTQSIKKFGYRGRNITLAALGAGTSLRGLNIKNARPDVMIFEDIQTREQADSEVLSSNLEKWMVGTAMKAKSPVGCLYIFVANMYPTPYSILRKLKANPTWTKFIAGGILADNTSLWEELQPIEQLTKEFENDLSMGHPEIFYAEVLNDENAASNNLIDLAKIPIYKIPDDEIPVGNFIVIDPAGYKVNSDNVAIGYFEVFDAVPVMRDLVNKQMSPGDCIREALKLALKNNCRLIAIESVAYQATLAYWFDFISKQLGISGINVVEVYPGGYSKNSRILGMFKQLLAGEVRLHPNVQAETYLQIVGFNPLKTNNKDDVLDLLTYAPKVLELFGEFIVSMSVIEMQEYEGAEVIEYNSPF